MSNASRDENSVPTLIAGLETDGKTLVRIQVDGTTHRLEVSDGTTGTDHGPGAHDFIDENSVRAILGVASRTVVSNGVQYIQGVTPVVAYATSNGKLLVQST